MTVAEILDANRGPHGWDRSRAESAINAALEIAAQEAEKAPIVQYFRYYGREGTMVDDTRGTLASLAAKIRSLKSPAQEPESA